MQSPRIQTARLLLRPFEMSDAADVFAYASNPNVSRFTTFETARTLADSEGRLAAERAGRIAAALVGHGAPSDRLAIGLREGDPAMLRVRFEIREEVRSQVTFKKEDGK